jgi:hypothetical protein
MPPVRYQLFGPIEDKIDDVKETFYNELEYVFEKFPKYYIEILLGYYSNKERREDIFKPTIGNDNLHKISNNNGVRVVNFALFKNQLKLQCCHIVIFINLFLLLQMGKFTIRLTIF